MKKTADRDLDAYLPPLPAFLFYYHEKQVDFNFEAVRQSSFILKSYPKEN